MGFPFVVLASGGVCLGLYSPDLQPLSAIFPTKSLRLFCKPPASYVDSDQEILLLASWQHLPHTRVLSTCSARRSGILPIPLCSAGTTDLAGKDPFMKQTSGIAKNSAMLMAMNIAK